MYNNTASHKDWQHSEKIRQVTLCTRKLFFGDARSRHVVAVSFQTMFLHCTCSKRSLLINQVYSRIKQYRVGSDGTEDIIGCNQVDHAVKRRYAGISNWAEQKQQVTKSFWSCTLHCSTYELLRLQIALD